MTAHDKELASLRRAQPEFPPSTQQPFAASFARLIGAASVALAISACGFVDGSSLTANESAAAGDASQATSDAAQASSDAAQTSSPVVETVAPRASGTATVSRSGSTGSSSASTTATVNTLDTVVNDMKLTNDAVLRGYEGRNVGWYVGPGIVQLGNDPRMTNAPQWFKDSYPSMISGTYMRAMLPWLVIFDGVGNAASNTRVHLRNMRAYYKSRATGEWRLLGTSPGVSGFNTAKSTLVAGSVAENKRVNGDGSVEVKPPTDTSLAWHGWWNSGKVTIEPTDIQAVFVTVQARLTVDDANQTDDRARAQYLVQTGADYYYDAAWQWTVGQPGVGTSRSKLVKNDWQAFNMMTFTDVGISDPGGGITEAQFRASPPPLE